MKAPCQCSKIQFMASTDKPLALYACHCTECRPQSSSAFSITAVFPLSLILLEATRALLSKGGIWNVSFAKNCGARLLHRFRDAMPQPSERASPTSSTNVKGGCLEGLDREMMKDIVHIWTRCAITDIPEGVERWDEAPPKANPLDH